jgi:hypothetical protein
LIGYDGIEFKIGDRVELSPDQDLWMRGAKFGVVEGKTADNRVKVRLELRPKKLFKATPDKMRKMR